MANQDDIKRWKYGKEHWNTWAIELLKLKDKIAAGKKWKLGNNALGDNLETKNWINKATVDFSNHQFEVGTDFKGIIFPYAAMLEDSDIPGAWTDNAAANFENAELINAKMGEVILSRSNFSGAKLQGAQIQKGVLKGVNFKGADLSGANLGGALLFCTNFKEAELLGVTFDHAVFDQTNFRGANLKAVKFAGMQLNKGTNFEQAILEKANLKGANCKQVKFEGANIKEAILDEADFQDAKFRGANIELASCNGTNFREANLDEVILSAVDLSKANLEKTSFQNAILNGANLQEAILKDVSFASAKLEDVNMRGAKLKRANFTKANLKRANLASTNLEDTKFSASTLIEANMLGASFNNGTNFSHDAKVNGLSVDRYALECLKDFGDMTVGQRMQLDTHDDVATLRSSYSGIWLWIHVAALFAFLFPYAWFIITQWSRAKFLSNFTEDYVPLWQAILRFVYSGGDGWESGWVFSWSFIGFLIALLFNILRAVLLAKTKSLEFSQEITELPALFSLNERVSIRFERINWRILYLAAQYGFYIYLIIVLLNTFHFLSMGIAIPHY